MELYRKTQVGWGLLAVLSVGIFASLYGFSVKKEVHLLMVAMFLVLAMVSLATLTIVVTKRELEIKMGIGLVRKRFSLEDIVSCRVVRNPWWYGWGIKTIPRGWLFSVSGLKAVELEVRNGKVYRIGSGEPEVLESVLRNVLRS